MALEISPWKAVAVTIPSIFAPSLVKVLIPANVVVPVTPNVVDTVAAPVTSRPEPPDILAPALASISPVEVVTPATCKLAAFNVLPSKVKSASSINCPLEPTVITLPVVKSST